MGKGIPKYTYRYACALALVLAVLLAGCKKNWLDAKTDKNLAVPSTLGDCQALLDNTGEMNANSCGIGEVASDGHRVLPSGWLVESDQEHNAYTWTHDKPVVSSPDWNAGYRRVAYCNQVLEVLGEIKPGNTGDQLWWNELKGAALFQRGRSFFELAQVFAPDYAWPLTINRPGIPLRLTTDVNELSVRATVGQTYDRILTDLRVAAQLLPLATAYKTRPSKPAALAMLARVYLAMQAYDSAYVYADSCLVLNHALLDYNGLDTGIATAYPVPRFSGEVIFHATLVKWGNILGDIMVDSSLYVLYDSSDLRRGCFFNCSAQAIQFKGSYYGGQLLFSGLAADEQYLIRAECRARRGDSAGAMSDVKTLLDKRYRTGSYRAPALSGAKEVLAMVLRERRKELYLRGLRWTDIRRLNHDAETAVTITRVAGGDMFRLEPGSYRYVFPIPDDIILATGMAQNAGW
jgi:hypothetical protein